MGRRSAANETQSVRPVAGSVSREPARVPNRSAGPWPPVRSRRPTLADLVDLEVCLRNDQSLPPEELNARDGAIGARIGAREVEDRDLVLAWLEEVRPENSTGRRAMRWRDRLIPCKGRENF